MNNKLLIGIIIVVIIVCAGVTAFIVTNNNNSMNNNMNITLNGVQFTVPASCCTVNDSGDGWSQYMSSDVCIMSFCSSGAGLGEAIKYGTAFNVLRGEFQTGAESVTVGNITLNKTSNGTYSYEYGDNSTHQNVLIVGTDKDIVANVVNSMVYVANSTNDTSNDNNTGDTTSTSKNTSQTITSASKTSGDVEVLYTDSSGRTVLKDPNSATGASVYKNGKYDHDLEGGESYSGEPVDMS